MVTVAIVNANEELLDILAEVFRRDGYGVATLHSRDLREGAADLTELAQRHDPAVMIYDIAVPYDANWELVSTLRRHPAMAGRKLVLTTTNKRALEALVGPTEAFEIVGKPFDLEQIRRAVARAVGATR